MVELFFMLLCAVVGFAIGISLGRIPVLQYHPRYLMAIAALTPPIAWAIRSIIDTSNFTFKLDLFIMLLGIGALVAGWEAELVIERQNKSAALSTLRSKWEQHRSLDSEDTSNPTI